MLSPHTILLHNYFLFDFCNTNFNIIKRSILKIEDIMKQIGTHIERPIQNSIQFYKNWIYRFRINDHKMVSVSLIR